MFGLKIIKQGEYRDLKEVANRHYDAHKKERAVYEQMKNDCDSLRKQNSELRKMVNAAMEDASGLKDLVILKAESCKCDKCSFSNSDDCTKIIFADRTICVTHKNNINDFKPKKKK